MKRLSQDSILPFFRRELFSGSFVLGAVVSSQLNGQQPVLQTNQRTNFCTNMKSAIIGKQRMPYFRSLNSGDLSCFRLPLCVLRTRICMDLLI